MERMFLLLGSNLNDRIGMVKTAGGYLQSHFGEPISAGKLYSSPSWGDPTQPDFINQILSFETSKSAYDVLEIILEIENKLGRIRNPENRNAGRTIDIDILYFGTQIISETPILEIPHPRIAHRRFVLLPMTEIAPEFVHPSLGLSQSELLALCEDQIPVTALP
jgi:2-amino-4-hydroxy-6-hydroxymethyldihydropteridine diphosphokinase